jgi:NADH-quinone oxidoreductase subunit M
MFDASFLQLFVLPLIGGLLVSLLPGRIAGVSRWIALVAMLLTLAVSIKVFVLFSGESSGAWVFNYPWFESFGINLHLAVDGFNLYLLLLTALLFPAALGCWWTAVECRRPLFLALLLFVQAGLMGTFLSQNLMLFFIFWEAVLIPMFIMILVFGSQKGRLAAQAFFLYTMAGSILLLAAVILLGVESLQQTSRWSFDLATLLTLQLDTGTQYFVFASIVLACAIKCPLVPFHSWLPLAYSEAPPVATTIMAGALSKMGAFALIKLAIPLCPEAAIAFGPGLIVLAVVSILYGAVMALKQKDYKLLVAYSSLSHMGYIVLGAFSFSATALHGALFQTFSHGLIVGGLFILLGLLEQRRGSAYCNLTALASTAPRMAVAIFLFILGSIALPLTSGFTGEFMILLGAFQSAFAQWQAGLGAGTLSAVLIGCSGMVLGAGYMLRFARTLLFGRDPGEGALADLKVREALPILSLLILIVWIGIAPAQFMAKVQSAVTYVSERPPGYLPDEADPSTPNIQKGVRHDQ